MDIETAMAEIYANRNGFRIEAVHPKHGRVTLYRNQKGVKVTPKDTPIRQAIKLTPRVAPSEPGSGEDG